MDPSQEFGWQRQGRALSPDERRAWDDDGFFIRPRVFGEDELAALRAGAERVAERAQDAVRTCRETYQIDGNRYCEAAGATIQPTRSPGANVFENVLRYITRPRES